MANFQPGTLVKTLPITSDSGIPIPQRFGIVVPTVGVQANYPPITDYSREDEIISVQWYDGAGIAGGNLFPGATLIYNSAVEPA